MAQKYKPARVSYETLLEHSLEWERLDYPRKCIIQVQRGKLHAIVRDNQAKEDLGIIFYSEKNGLPCSEFPEKVQYLFWKQTDKLNASRPIGMGYI